MHRPSTSLPLSLTLLLQVDFLDQCRAWSRLLNHDSIADLLARVEGTAEVAETHLGSRHQLWTVLANWDR